MRYADMYCKYIETYNPHMYVFTGPCKHTKKLYAVKVPAEELHKYRQGAMIQDAMPSVSLEDREFLISGYSPEGWNALFADSN